MRIFILEDDPARIVAFEHVLIGHDVTICKWLMGMKYNTHRSSDDGAFVRFKPPYDLILLDHDLGGRQMVDSTEVETGYQFAKWLVNNHPTTDGKGPLVIIHSYNPDGARNMAHALRDGGYGKIDINPFGPTVLKYLQSLPKEPKTCLFVP